jgi:hypothetical protein
LFIEKFIINDFYFVSLSIDGIITKGFKDKKACQTKKHYRLHFVDTSIGDLIYIADGMNPLVIYI